MAGSIIYEGYSKRSLSQSEVELVVEREAALDCAIQLLYEKKPVLVEGGIGIFGSISVQAQNIAIKTNVYGNDVKVIVDMKNLNSADKAQFKSDLANVSVDMSKVHFLND